MKLIRSYFALQTGSRQGIIGQFSEGGGGNGDRNGCCTEKKHQGSYF